MQGTTFEKDALMVMVDFIKQNKSEFIIMMIRVEIREKDAVDFS